MPTRTKKSAQAGDVIRMIDSDDEMIKMLESPEARVSLMSSFLKIPLRPAPLATKTARPRTRRDQS